MNEARTEEDAGWGGTDQSANREPAELVARIEQLEAELEDFHRRYQRVSRSQYRGTAVVLGLIGIASVIGAWVFPDSREVLFALGGLGLFTAVLIYYITPKRFIPVQVGERVYEALASNQAAIVSELGLQDTRVYVPVSTGAAGNPPKARLFVPHRTDYAVPSDHALENRFVITGDEAHRGMSFEPSAAGLIDEFETTLSAGLSESPTRLAAQLADGLVSGFELVDAVTSEGNGETGRVRFAVAGSAYPHVDGFDNPIVSFLATGLATGLRVPVTTTVTIPADGSTADFIVTCAWSSGEGGEEPPAAG